MGFTEADVLEMAKKLAADFTFSSKRGPYVFIDPAVERLMELAAEKDELKKITFTEEDDLQRIFVAYEEINRVEEEKKEQEKEKGKRIEPRDSPGGMANVIKPPVDYFRKADWGKKDPYNVKWIAERPEGEVSTSRNDMPFEAKYEDKFTLISLYPLDFTYANFLWSLRHNIRSTLDFELDYADVGWESFLETQETYGEAIAQESRETDKDRIHISITNDYQVPLANFTARKRVRSEGRRKERNFFGVHYDHIPWPDSNHFSLVEDPVEYLSRLLEGNKIYGLQTDDDIGRFKETVERFLPKAKISWDDYLEGYTVKHRGHETLVKSYMVGIDVDEFRQRAEAQNITFSTNEFRDSADWFRKEHDIPDDAILFYGIDRGGEQTKRVLQKFNIFAEYLEMHKDDHDRDNLYLYQICDPNRQYLPEYRQRLDEIRDAAAEINKRFPGRIILDDSWHQQDELLPLHLAGDFLWVNSVDGYNLVADEASTLSDMGERPTVPMVSKYAGCSNKLKSTDKQKALVFDAFDKNDIFRTLDEAYGMSIEERLDRANALVETVRDRDINDYMGRILESIIKIYNKDKERHEKLRNRMIDNTIDYLQSCSQQLFQPFKKLKEHYIPISIHLNKQPHVRAYSGNSMVC